jgi:quercetin dioxygenase-like cupin family protein
MLHLQLSPDHEDARGTITDLIDGKVDAVTLVRTKAGAIRGNHLHRETTQWAYIVSGSLLISTGEEEITAKPGDLVINTAGEPHAWKALEDTVCVVFVEGPRAGKAYESDTVRLSEPLIA